MRENRLRTLWKADRYAINGWLAIANSFSAEVMAQQGWDSLTIDMQHGLIDDAAMVTMLQAISTSATHETRAAMAQRVFDNLSEYFAHGRLVSAIAA